MVSASCAPTRWDSVRPHIARAASTLALIALLVVLGRMTAASFAVAGSLRHERVTVWQPPEVEGTANVALLVHCENGRDIGGDINVSSAVDRLCADRLAHAQRPWYVAGASFALSFAAVGAILFRRIFGIWPTAAIRMALT